MPSPSVTLGGEPAFQKIIRSKRYNALTPEKRKVLLQGLLDLNPEERAELGEIMDASGPAVDDQTQQKIALIEKLADPNPTYDEGSQQVMNGVLGLGLTATNPAVGIPAIIANQAITTMKNKGLPTGLRDAGAMGTDILGQTVGAYLGGKVPLPGASVIGEGMGAVAADRFNRAVGLRDPKTVSLPFVGDIPNKKVAGPITTGDIMSAAPTLAFRGAAGAAKFATKPAQRAIRHADDLNAAAKQKYDTNVENVLTQNLNEAAATHSDNAQKALKWRHDGEVLERELRADLGKIRFDASLTEEARRTAYQTRLTQYHEDLIAHRQAATDIPVRVLQDPEGNPLPQVGGHAPYYVRARNATITAEGVDATPIRNVARELNIDFNLPPEGLRNTSRFPRITEALSDLGITRTADATDEFGTLPSTGPRITNTDVPLVSILEGHKRLGRLVGQTADRGGEEARAARRLYATFTDVLTNQTTRDPAARAAVEAQREAATRFMREESARDLLELFQDPSIVRPLAHGQVEINAQALRNGLRRLETEDRFYTRAFSPEERAFQRQVLDEVPQQGVRNPGVEPVPRGANDRLRSRLHTYEKALERHTEQAPGSPLNPYKKAAFKEAPTPPVAVEPDLGNLPVGQFIMTKIGVSELAGRLMGYGGPAPAIGIAVALGTLGVPFATSKALLASSHGRQIVKNIMDGKQKVTPALLSALESMAGKIGEKEGTDE